MHSCVYTPTHMPTRMQTVAQHFHVHEYTHTNVPVCRHSPTLVTHHPLMHVCVCRPPLATPANVQPPTFVTCMSAGLSVPQNSPPPRCHVSGRRPQEGELWRVLAPWLTVLLFWVPRGIMGDHACYVPQRTGMSRTRKGGPPL